MSVVTGYVVQCHPESFCLAFGCVEELRAFPERLTFVSHRFREARERASMKRIQKAREALALLDWRGCGDCVVALPIGEMSERDILRAVVKCRNTLEQLREVIPVHWGVERLAVAKLVGDLGRARFESLPAESVGAL
jgi:hypothetical protein